MRFDVLLHVQPTLKTEQSKWTRANLCLKTCGHRLEEKKEISTEVIYLMQRSPWPPLRKLQA